MFFDNNDYMDLNMLYNITGINNTEDFNEGFLKGNMFDNIYDPYKNMTYIKPKVNNKKDELLFKIMEYNFAIIDYSLYLDVNPDDEMILNKYKDASKMLEDLCNKYEQKYGPLEINNANYDKYEWINSPWPWDKEDSMYV